MKVRVFQKSGEKKRRGARKCPWSVQWRQNNGRHSKTIGAKADAEKFAAIKQAELLDKQAGVVTTKLWSEFVEEYDRLVVANFRSEQTKLLTRQILRTFREICKPKLVYAIDRLDLDQYVTKRLKMPGKKAGDTLSPATVQKELRHIRAALSTAKDWNYLRSIPRLPRVKGHQKDKRFMTEDHFNVIMVASDQARQPDPRIHLGMDAGTWWRALLATAWTSGMRIGALMALRWDDVDLDRGVVWSRGRDNKGKRDTKHDIQGAVEFLRLLPRIDPRVFPWNHHRRTLDVAFHAIQRAAGIVLTCPEKHEHTDACRAYGFHDVRRSHATYNYGKVSDRALQQQMGHASFATTQQYIRYAELHQTDAYPAHLPLTLQGGQALSEKHQNGTNDGNKPALRVVSA